MMNNRKPLLLKRVPARFRGESHRQFPPDAAEKTALRKIRSSGLPVYFELERIDHLDKLRVPVYVVDYPDVFNNSANRAAYPGRYAGAGLTPTSARLSALMGRVERFTASDLQVDDIVYSAFDDLKNAVSRWDFVPCNQQKQLYSKKDLDRQRLPWTRAFSLTSGKDVLIPANLAYFKSFAENHDYSYTTGLASGSSVEEAVLHGLCEVIKHHLQEVVYHNSVKTPLLDLDSVTDPELRELIQAFRAKGIDLRVNILSQNLGAAAF